MSKRPGTNQNDRICAGTRDAVNPNCLLYSHPHTLHPQTPPPLKRASASPSPPRRNTTPTMPTPNTLTLSVPSLSVPYLHALTWFAHVPLLRTNPPTLRRSLLCLALARLRLSHWGDALGVRADRNSAAPARLSATQWNAAKRLLERIALVFRERVARGSMVADGRERAVVARWEEGRDLDGEAAALLRKLEREMAHVVDVGETGWFGLEARDQAEEGRWTLCDARDVEGVVWEVGRVLDELERVVPSPELVVGGLRNAVVASARVGVAPGWELLGLLLDSAPGAYDELVPVVRRGMAMRMEWEGSEAGKAGGDQAGDEMEIE